MLFGFEEPFEEWRGPPAGGTLVNPEEEEPPLPEEGNRSLGSNLKLSGGQFGAEDSCVVASVDSRSSLVSFHHLFGADKDEGQQLKPLPSIDLDFSGLYGSTDIRVVAPSLLAINSYKGVSSAADGTRPSPGSFTGLRATGSRADYPLFLLRVPSDGVSHATRPLLLSARCCGHLGTTWRLSPLISCRPTGHWDSRPVDCRFASVSMDKTLRLWDVEEEDQGPYDLDASVVSREVACVHHPSYLDVVTEVPWKKWVVTGEGGLGQLGRKDGFLRVFDVYSMPGTSSCPASPNGKAKTKSSLVRAIGCHGGHDHTALASDPTRCLLISGGNDATVQFWDLRSSEKTGSASIDDGLERPVANISTQCCKHRAGDYACVGQVLAVPDKNCLFVHTYHRIGKWDIRKLSGDALFSVNPYAKGVVRQIGFDWSNGGVWCDLARTGENTLVSAGDFGNLGLASFNLEDGRVTSCVRGNGVSIASFARPWGCFARLAEVAEAQVWMEEMDERVAFLLEQPEEKKLTVLSCRMVFVDGVDLCLSRWWRGF